MFELSLKITSTIVLIYDGILFYRTSWKNLWM